MHIYNRVTLGLFILLLVVQVSFLHPSFSWPEIKSGEFLPVLVKDTLALPRTVHQAYFASYGSNEKTGLIFTGDVLLARNVEYLMNREGIDYPFSGISLSNILPGAAIIGNFESAMPETHMPTPALAMRFSVDPALLPALKTAGYTHLSQANNHSFDYGLEGFSHGSAALLTTGIIPFGSGHSIGKESITYVNTESGRIAIVGIHATDVIPARSTLKNVMALASADSDFQIIYIHWGTEYKLVHNPAQEELAKTLISQGADLIVGHHPHVVQDIDIIDNVVVFYSLGNYVFDQYFNDDVEEGLVLSLALSGDRPHVRILPVTSHATLSQPIPMPEAERTAFLKELAARSNRTLSSEIMSGVVPLETMVATSQKMAMIGR